jgi:hypothetical protein
MPACIATGVVGGTGTDRGVMREIISVSWTAIIVAIKDTNPSPLSFAEGGFT